MPKFSSHVSVVAVGLGGVLATLGSSAAHAQVRFEIAPWVGSYYAVANTGLTEANTEERQENQPAFGVALVARLNQLLGAEASFAYVKSGVNIDRTGAAAGARLALPGTLISASGRVRLWAPRSNFYGLAGAGIVSRGGDAWDGFSSKSAIAGILGFGIQAEVSPAVRIDVKAEVQFYSFDPDGNGTTYESKLMPDVLVGIGIPIALNRS